MDENIKIVDLERYVPDFICEIPEMKALYYIEGIELGLLREQIEDVLAQFNIRTATWGLRIYEDMYGIEYNPSLSYEERREIVESARRGRGVTDVEMLKTTIAAFDCGESDITRHDTEGWFEVKFTSIKGIPRNLNALKERINIIKPAHLNVEYKYTYNTWGEVYGNKDNTEPFRWGELYSPTNSKNWTWEDVLMGRIKHSDEFIKKSIVVFGNDDELMVFDDDSEIRFIETAEDLKE